MQDGKKNKNEKNILLPTYSSSMIVQQYQPVLQQERAQKLHNKVDDD